MSAPFQTWSVLRGCLQMTKKSCPNSTTMLRLSHYGNNRTKIKSRKVIKDPRKNAQYPYIPGDPHHEDLVKINSVIVNNGNTSRQNRNPVIIQSNSAGVKNMNVTKYGHPFEMLQEGDRRLGSTILKAKSSSDTDVILLEGYRLIRDAIRLGAEIKNLYFCREEVLKELPPSMLPDAQIFKILYRDLKTWSDTSTPSGILGVFKKPRQGEVYSLEEPRFPLTLIIDGLKDPGNVGTLIRSAAAVGCERILTLKGSVDVWEGKVLRSGMGGHFAVPIYTGLTWSQVYGYVSDDTQVFLADARTDNDVVMEFDKSLSAEQFDKGSSDSDSDDSSSCDEAALSRHSVSNSQRRVTSEMYQHVPCPVIPYSSMHLRDTFNAGKISIAMVIGSETAGLSSSAKKFGHKRYGTFVTVPMNPVIDSLNTAVAGSIILYEIRRKLADLKLNQTFKER